MNISRLNSLSSELQNSLNSQINLWPILVIRNEEDLIRSYLQNNIHGFSSKQKIMNFLEYVQYQEETPFFYWEHIVSRLDQLSGVENQIKILDFDLVKQNPKSFFAYFTFPSDYVEPSLFSVPHDIVNSRRSPLPMEYLRYFFKGCNSLLISKDAEIREAIKRLGQHLAQRNKNVWDRRLN